MIGAASISHIEKFIKRQKSKQSSKTTYVFLLVLEEDVYLLLFQGLQTLLKIM